jgi:hypothetical protein
MFDHLSLSTFDTLPTKAYHFTVNLFKDQPHTVPPLGWFRTVIPAEDPTGVTYFALVRLEDRATGRSHPSGHFENAPLAVYIRALLFQATIAYCADYLETILDRPREGCGVCEWREEWLLKGADDDPYQAEWFEENGDASVNENINIDPRAVGSVLERRVEEVRQTMDMGDVCRKMANI